MNLKPQELLKDPTLGPTLFLDNSVSIRDQCDFMFKVVKYKENSREEFEERMKLLSHLWEQTSSARMFVPVLVFYVIAEYQEGREEAYDVPRFAHQMMKDIGRTMNIIPEK
jgi:hypothetical protein